MIRALVLSLVLALPAQAQTDPASAASAAAELLEAAALGLSEASSARDRVEALTATLRAYEEGLLALREGIRQAAVRERSILLVFEAERDRLARLLSVLQRIEGTPTPATLLHPEGPLGTARSGMIVADVAPAVAREALALRGQLEELAELRALQDRAVVQLQTALEGVQQARSDLSQAIADRRELPERFSLNTDAMRQILESVDSLDSFAQILRDAPAEGIEDLPDFAETRGSLPLPVLGALLRRFNEADAAGIVRPGVVLAVRPRAMLTAPWPASVRYAGPLLDYGNVIILEPQADYLVILAGAGDLFVRAGDILRAGAPLGLMPGTDLAGTDLIRTDADGGVGLTETLYIEVREGPDPVDPAAWFMLN